MKLNVGAMYNNQDRLNKIGNFDFGSPITNYRFARLLKKTAEEVRLYMSEQIKLFEKYGKQNNDGSFSVEKDKIAELNQKLEELSTVEFDVDWDKPDVKLNSLSGFTASEMNFIENYFINIVEEDKNNGN